MRFTLLALALLSFALSVGSLVGCRRGRNSAPPPAASTQAVPVEMPAGAPPPAPVDAGGATRATHDAVYIQEMTSTLNDFLADYIRQHKRVPRDINEMMSLKLITSIPVLPGGKKWVINQQTGKISAQ